MSVHSKWIPILSSSAKQLLSALMAGKLALRSGACHTVMWGAGVSVLGMHACSVLRDNYQDWILICMLSTCHDCSPFSHGNTNDITTISVHMH